MVFECYYSKNQVLIECVFQIPMVIGTLHLQHTIEQSQLTYYEI